MVLIRIPSCYFPVYFFSKRRHGKVIKSVKSRHKNYVIKILAYSNADNKKRIGEAGGIAMILNMMDVHGASNADVANYGCNALWNLIADAPNVEIIGETGTINTDNKRKILAANGESMVERMKSTWASNDGVQKNADGALRKLR